jgi:hypothetical protein
MRLCCHAVRHVATRCAGVLLWRRTDTAHRWAHEWWRKGVTGGPDGKYRRKYFDQTAIKARSRLVCGP